MTAVLNVDEDDIGTRLLFNVVLCFLNMLLRFLVAISLFQFSDESSSCISYSTMKFKLCVSRCVIRRDGNPARLDCKTRPKVITMNLAKKDYNNEPKLNTLFKF